MNSIFDYMFRLGYSNDLHEHLKGLDSQCNDYTATSTYQIVFWVMVGLSLVAMINYYKGFFHRPKFTSKMIWFAHLMTVSGIVFLFAFLHSTSDLNNSKFCEDLQFNTSDCALFALTMAAYTFFFCLLLSLILKLVSVHHKKIPF